MKKILVFSIALLTVIVQLLASGTEPLDGDGDGKREVSTLDHLLWISTNLAGWSYSYEQTADIDVAACSTWSSGAGWTPIGNDVGGDYRFKGSYDGQGHVISNLYINRTGTDYVGFFGKTHCADIMNLGLTNVDIDGKTYVGGLVGYAEGGSITSCYSSGTVHSSGQITGGLAGKLQSVNVSNSYSSCGVSSDISSAGGFVGLISGSVTINRCYASGNASASSTASQCGGFAGIIPNNAPNYSKVNDCYSTGNASGNNRVGGFAGECDQGFCIYRCFSSGRVSGWGEGFGAFVGYGGGASNSFFDAETDNIGTTSSGSNSGGAIGKTTEEMKTLATFTGAGWDFEAETNNGTADIWDMDLSGNINNGYPYLFWEDGEDVSLPVTLSFFTAKEVKGTVVLEWETSAEVENQGFLISRQSTVESQTSEMIASFTTDEALKGQGTTTETTRYSWVDKTVQPGMTYIYTLYDVDYEGRETRQAEVEVKPREMSEVYFTGEAEGAIVADGYSLNPAYPNPFNARFTLPFTLTEPMQVTVELYTLTGQNVMTVVNREFGTGTHHVTVDVNDLASGVYFVRTGFDNRSHMQKVMLLK